MGSGRGGGRRRDVNYFIIFFKKKLKLKYTERIDPPKKFRIYLNVRKSYSCDVSFPPPPTPNPSSLTLGQGTTSDVYINLKKQLFVVSNFFSLIHVTDKFN